MDKYLYLYPQYIIGVSMLSRGYVAGFIDGEGTIGLYKHKDKRIESGYSISAVVKISNTDKDILIKFQKQFGGAIKKVQSTTPNGQKEVYSLAFYNFKKIQKILQYIKNDLILKRKQAKLMLEFCQSRLKRSMQNYSKRELILLNSFPELNKRGKGGVSEGAD